MTTTVGIALALACAPTGEREPIQTGLAEGPRPRLEEPPAPKRTRLPTVVKRFEPQDVLQRPPEQRALMLEVDDQRGSPDRFPLELQLRVAEPEVWLELINRGRTRTYWRGHDPHIVAYFRVDDAEGNEVQAHNCTGPEPDPRHDYGASGTLPMSLAPGERVQLKGATVVRTGADVAVMWQHGTIGCWVFPLEGTVIRAFLRPVWVWHRWEAELWQSRLRRSKRTGRGPEPHDFVFLPPNEKILDRLVTPKLRWSNSVLLHPRDKPFEGPAVRRPR